MCLRRLAVVALAIVGCSRTTSPTDGGGEGEGRRDAGLAGEGEGEPDGGECSSCGSACVDLSTDPFHCGECGTSCGGQIPCAEGRCQCPAGTLHCGDLCVDARTDEAHCGGCESACEPDVPCVEGSCGCTVEADCPESAGCFDGVCRRCGAGCGGCVDYESDPDNCGGCGARCLNAPCVDGRCRCAEDEVACGGDSEDYPSVFCVARATMEYDRWNCGGCGECDQPGEHCCWAQWSYCGGGECQIVPGAHQCLAPLTWCGPSCIDLSMSFRNCGACGASCQEGETCSQGVCVPCAGDDCVPSCPEGLILCDDAYGEERCTDPNTDFFHCGGCWDSCGPDEVCIEGRCRFYRHADDGCESCGASLCCEFSADFLACVGGETCPQSVE